MCCFCYIEFEFEFEFEIDIAFELKTVMNCHSSHFN